MPFRAAFFAKQKAHAKLRAFFREEENVRLVLKGENIKKSFGEKCTKFFSNIFPPLKGEGRPPPRTLYEKIFWEGTFQNTLLKYVALFIACQSVGTLFITTLIAKYPHIPGYVPVSLSMFTQIITILVFIFPFVRSVFLLAMPSLSTSKLRKLALVMMMGWAFQSSAQNISRNVSEASKSINCVQEVQHQAMRDLMSGAQNMGAKMLDPKQTEALITEIEEGPMNKVLKFMKKMQDACSKFQQMQAKMISFYDNVAYECGLWMRQPFTWCEQAFETFSDACNWEKISWICNNVQPVKKVICASFRHYGQFCYMSRMAKDYANQGLSKITEYVKEHTIERLRHTFAFKLTHGLYNVKGIKIHVVAAHEANVTSSIDKKAILRKVKEDLDMFDFVSKIMSLIYDNYIIVVMVWPFIAAVKYAIKYITHESYDNHYITAAFKKIDQKREKIGETAILPLTPNEHKKYIMPTFKRMFPPEKVKVVINLSFTLFQALIPFILGIIDYFTYEAVYQSWLFFHKETTKANEDSMYVLNVEGKGALASMFKNVLDVVEPVNKGLKTKVDIWRQCFIEPNPPNFKLYKLMFMMFCMSIVMCVLEVYALRLRQWIAGRCYPDRRNVRAMWLYIKIMDERKTVLADCMRLSMRNLTGNNIIKDVKEGRGNLIQQALPSFAKDHHSCTRCGRIDLVLNDAGNVRVCVQCNALYCVDCITVMKKCRDCNYAVRFINPELEFVDDSSFEESDSDYEDLIEDYLNMMDQNAPTPAVAPAVALRRPSPARAHRRPSPARAHRRLSPARGLGRASPSPARGRRRSSSRARRRSSTDH